jgi:sugar lactone lactonase YvrE
VSTAERITQSLVYHGEGPMWDGSVLRWVDMLAGDVLRLSPEGGVTRQHVGEVAAALRPRVGGGLVIAIERGFALIDRGSDDVVALPPVWDDPGIRMNEGGCDPDGRFYCGSMAYDARPGAGSLYRLDLDRSVHVILTGVTISNGLVFAPDGKVVYYIDTPTQRVDAFDYADGAFANRRPVVRIDREQGSPDGMTVDAEGGLWVALYRGSAVHRYEPDGTLTEVIDVPARQVTACTFGGADLDELYITTSRENLAEGDDPQAGSLFRARPGVRGLAALPFAA